MAELELDVGMVELDVGIAYASAKVDTIISEKIIMFIDNRIELTDPLPLGNRFLFI